MNVLKRLIIPRMHLTIAYILSELEELEREDTFRLKRVKEKKMKKAKVDGAGEKIENIELSEKENAKLEETIEPETEKPENTTEPEKMAKPDKTTKLITESVLDSKAVQPKEAAEMGDLIVLKPPDDRMELGDVYLPPPGLKTMATITEVEELIEGISEIKKGMENIKTLKEIQSDDEKIQLVEDDIKNDVENMETGEWFETPPKLENMAMLNEELSLYSKMEKLKDVISGVIEAETTSEAKMSLKADASIIDIDKRALTSLYKDIDSNFYQPTVDDIFSKHNIAMQDSVSQDISILDHSLVDLESIDFSIDSEGKVVVSKHDIVQTSPVISTQEADALKLMTGNDKNNQLVAPTGRISSVKWINESKTEEEELMSQFEDKIDGKPAEQNDKPDDLQSTADIIKDKSVENITEYTNLKKLEDAEGNEKTRDTSAVEMHIKPDESIIDLDKRALASLHKGIDSNFYQPTVDDIFSKHDLVSRDSLSKDVAILDNSLIDLDSIDFSIDSKGKVVISKRDSDQPSPLSTRKSDVLKQMASNSKDDRFVSPSSKIPSIQWEGEGQKREESVSQMEFGINNKVVDKSNDPTNLDTTKDVIDEKAVENVEDTHNLKNVVGRGRETDTSADKIPLGADGSINDIDERALASLYRGIDSNFYKPTVNDIFSKHDLTIQDSNSLRDLSILDHSLLDLESIDFSIDSKGKVVVSKHGNQASLLLTQEAGGSKQRESYDKDGFVAPTGRISSVKWLGESRKEGEGFVSPLEHAVDGEFAENIISANDLKSTGQVGEKDLDDVTDSNISVTKGNNVGNDVIKMNKHQDLLENEILTINDKDFEIQSNVSLEEKEVWTSNTEEIPKNPISGKLTTKPAKEVNQKSLRSKISRSISDENLSRISEEDYMEQDTSKLNTLGEELKEIKISEKKETEGSVISDKFEDCKTSFHDSGKSSLNYEEITQQHDLKKDVETTKNIKHVESKVFNQTENLNNLQSNLKINDEYFTQVQSTSTTNSFRQHNKDINQMSNKSFSDINKSRKITDSEDTSKINQKNESNARIENVNDFVKDNLKTNFEQRYPIESVNQSSFNSENERNRSVTYTQYENTDTNKGNIQNTVRQGSILNEINIPESLPENNLDGMPKDNNDSKRDDYGLKMGRETQASEENIEKLLNIHQTISNIGENKPLQIKDLENTFKVKEHQRDSNSSLKTEAKKASHDKHQKLNDSVEHVNEREGRNSEIEKHTKRISQDMHESKTKESVKEVVNIKEKDDSGGMISTNSNKINNFNNESAEKSKKYSQSRIEDKSNHKPVRHSNESIKSVKENIKGGKNSNIKILEDTKIHSESNIDAELKEIGREDKQQHKPLKVQSREILNSSNNIENTKRYSLNYQDDKIISKDIQSKESIQKELHKDKIHEKPLKLQSSSEIIEQKQDHEKVRKDSQSKEDSSNKALEIHTHELHESEKDISITENSKRDSQNDQEDKKISIDSQGKERIQKELHKNKIHEKPLQLHNSSENINNEQDYERLSKDSQSKEDGQSEKDSQSEGVSDTDSDQKASQKNPETESRSSNAPVLPERCNLCGTYHKKQD